jgi:hypothetical protein
MLEVEIYPIELELAQLDEDVALLVVERLDERVNSCTINRPSASQRAVGLEIQGVSSCSDSLELLKLREVPRLVNEMWSLLRHATMTTHSSDLPEFLVNLFQTSDGVSDGAEGLVRGQAMGGLDELDWNTRITRVNLDINIQFLESKHHTDIFISRELNETHAKRLQVFAGIKLKIVLHCYRFDVRNINRLAASGIELSECFVKVMLC